MVGHLFNGTKRPRRPLVVALCVAGLAAAVPAGSAACSASSDGSGTAHKSPGSAGQVQQSSTRAYNKCVRKARKLRGAKRSAALKRCRRLR